MIEQVLRAYWDLQPPLQVEQVTTGINNLSYQVHSGSGDFFLKMYQNVDSGSRIEFELALLRALAHAHLPFAVPGQMPTASGHAFASLPDDSVCCLSHRIPGQSGWRDDPSLAFRAGRALAVLDGAMARVEIDDAITIPSTFGTLIDGHLAITDMHREIHAAFPDRDMARAIGTTVASAEHRWRTATIGWPTQIIHADYFPANVLVLDGEISGVVDFEFVGVNHRAMDFAIGLFAFGIPWQTFAPGLKMIEAFATGYLSTTALSADELIAVPDLIRMREASSFVPRLGRMKLGLISVDEMSIRGRRLLDLDAWLGVHGDEMVTRLARIARA